MGGNVSKQVSSTLNQTVRDISTQLISENLVATESDVKASQLQNIRFDNTEINCNLTISQDATVKNKVYQQMTLARKNDLETELANQLQSVIQKELEAKIKGIAIGANVSKIQNSVKNIDYTKIATVVANTTQAIVNNSLLLSQEQNLVFVDTKLCADNNGQINLVQNLNIDNVVENVFSSQEVTDVLAEVENTVIQDIETTEKLVNEGPNLLGLLGLLMIIPVILIGFVIYRVVKTGKQLIPLPSKT